MTKKELTVKARNLFNYKKDKKGTFYISGKPFYGFLRSWNDFFIKVQNDRDSSIWYELAITEISVIIWSEND